MEDERPRARLGQEGAAFSRIRRSVAVGIIVVPIGFFAACRTDPPAPVTVRAAATVVHPRPAPTEHRLDDDAEERNSSLRKQWHAERHRTAPGTDWKAIEKENGERIQDLRNRLARAKSGRPDAAWTEQLERVDRRITRLGAINLAAIDEYEAQSERKTYLDAQHEDLEKALDTLSTAIRRIDRETRTRFKETFAAQKYL